MRRAVARSEGFREEAADVLEELERSLPLEARRAFGRDETERAAMLERLAAEGIETAVAHLRESAAEED